VDGLVLSRSAFDHSMKHRCVVAFGTSPKIADPEQKVKSLRAISEHLIAGRWADVRGPGEKELETTTVLEFSIEKASSKVRSGPPLNDESDHGLPGWAGALPLEIKSRPLYQTTNWSKVSVFPTMSGVMMLGSLAIQR
jgi:hypothetical protein